jgi:cation transport ATPase
MSKYKTHKTSVYLKYTRREVFLFAAGVLYPINGFLLNPVFASISMALSFVSVVNNSILMKKDFRY